MPMLVQRMSAAMTRERTGSIQLRAGVENARAPGDDGGGGERVSGHVQEGAAHVDVARHPPQQGGDYAVHENAGGGHGHHQFRLDSDWCVETMHGFNADPDGDDDEG